MTQLDQLLQKYEFENSQLSKAIQTEKDKLAIVQRQRNENEVKISEFENIISNLEKEIGHEMKYGAEKEREIERIKNETYIMRDHRNTKRNSLDKKKESYEEMVTNAKEIIRDSSQKYNTYMQKYETIPWAKKILNERAKAADMRGKIEQADGIMIALNRKENELREMSEEKNQDVGKVDIQVKKLLIQCADFRKGAVSKFKKFAAKRIMEIKARQSQLAANSSVKNQQNFKGRRSLSERNLGNVTPLRPFQIERYSQRDNSFHQESSNDLNDSCNSARQLDDADVSDNHTSTPKLIPRFTPGVQLSPLTAFLGSNLCSESPLSNAEPSKRVKRRTSFNPQSLKLSPIKSPNPTALTNSPNLSPALAHIHSLQRRTRKFSVDSHQKINKASPFINNSDSPVIQHSNLAISNNPTSLAISNNPASSHNLCYSSNEMTYGKQTNKENPQKVEGGRKELSEAANEKRNDDREFRFGFMEESPHSSNPFSTDSPDPKMATNAEGSSDFQNLFTTGSGMLNQPPEAPDNPFSFVP